MVRRRRFSRQQWQEVWDRWCGQESLETIAAALQVSSSGVFGEIRRRGGIPPRPAVRRTSALTASERTVIERGTAAGLSMRAIATSLGRAPSTISRELRRHGQRTGRQRSYHAPTAERRAWQAARRPKRGVLATHRALRRVVSRKLAAQWSPAQIAGWLRRTYPEDLTMQVSAETIYRTLYVQARGALRRELVQHLRRGQSLRHRQTRAKPGGRSRIVDAVSISERPPESADRAIPGHWEGDLLAGSGQSYIATLVERASRFVVLVKVDGKDSATVVRALIRRVQRLPAGLMASLTWDRGGELAQHQQFTVATDVAVYFCDPYSPWQRGTNENTNGLLRQYFPKGTDLSRYTQRQLDAVAVRLNARPRQTLGFQTPAEFLAARVASTG
jgi:transposase, IS30 family